MESQETISKIADIILDELAHFESQFLVKKPQSVDVFACPPSTEAVSSLSKSRSEVYSSQLHLRQEPFIAYVKASINGKERILYICKGFTPHPSITTKAKPADYVNYYSKMGRAVEERINSQFTFTVNDRVNNVTVLEKNLFKPLRSPQEWDGINNSIFLHSGTFSFDSLIAFLRSYHEMKGKKEAAAFIEQLEELEKQLIVDFEKTLNVKHGLIREVVNKMELRDQPILDDIQGDIFRIPLSTQIIITGAPGTGKTTTLIKRIAQKSDPNFIDEDDLLGVGEAQIEQFFNKQNWIMFAPTELLKIYLKEAFAKELLPASDQRVRIWEDESRLIGRDTLKFLKIGDKGIFRSTTRNLLSSVKNIDLIEYSNKFHSFYGDCIAQEFKDAYNTLSANQSTPNLLQAFGEITEKLEEWTIRGTDDRVIQLIEELSRHRDKYSENRRKLNLEIDNLINNIIAAKSDILHQIHAAIQTHAQDTASRDSDEDDEFDEEINTPPVKDILIMAKAQLRNTLTFYLVRLLKGEKSVKSKLHLSIIDIVSSYLPDPEYLTAIAKKIVDGKASDKITRGYFNILQRIPNFYQRFRIDQLNTDSSLLNRVHESDIRNKSICSHEIDLLIYVMLKNARRILSRKPELLNSNSKNEILEGIKSRYVTQIVVDEATDFSSIQLGCMYYLSHPQYDSFSIAGDLMQRVTEWGLTDWDQCKFITSRFEEHSIDTVYRQSPKLLHIAEKLYENSTGQKAPFVSAFHGNSSDPDPLKFKSNHDVQSLAMWIGDRISEIYMVRYVLPSTAIFVAEDEQIDDVVNFLKEPLENHSISIKGCPRGEIMGSEGKVRVFSIKFIKGLEFESVFFLDLDKIGRQSPDLVDKYLYVGLTRAASFLAVTYHTRFPEQVNYIEEFFREGDWSSYVP